jgi:hypothetical protein
MAITHSTVATLPDEVGAEINKAEWNDAHIVTDGSFTIAKTTGLQTALDGKQPIDASLTEISALVLSADNILQQKAGVLTNRTPAQFKTDLVLVKADVELGNVDNTSDANKPVSTATQTALNLKSNLASPTFTGVVVLPNIPTIVQTALDLKEDDLPSIIGNMGKVLAVNGTETGKEWIVAGGTDIIGKQRSWIGI